LRFLSDDLRDRIIAEGRDLICTLGVEVHNPGVLTLLTDAGARHDRASGRVHFTEQLIDRALKSAPRSFHLYDSLGQPAEDLSGYNVHFTPGSAAINILDSQTQAIRRPTSADYIEYARLMAAMDNISSQSTAMIPADVPERMSDSYRLFLSLLNCEKPVVTGTFTVESFTVMKDLQVAVRGSEGALAEKPLTVFSCCPTSPLKWSHVTSQNVVDCARYGIPVEFISMPLSGFMAPVTLVGSLVQHTAETLSGLVISQLARPGTPVLWGGSPAVFDIRYETTPMGAIETMMIDCACNEIGKELGLPTQAYIALSDAKSLDAQAGLETAMGAVLAALSGINHISGPGMLDFESCFSLEKLVCDNEICGSVLRMTQGITPHEDFPALPRFQELLAEGHLLISEHTRKYLKSEIQFPRPVIDRANQSRWKEEGSRSLIRRAHEEVRRALEQHSPPRLPEHVRRELIRLMTSEAHTHGLSTLPGVDL